jgi:hypothetical protein
MQPQSLGGSEQKNPAETSTPWIVQRNKPEAFGRAIDTIY